jgi:hypothetical protein
MVTPSSTTRMTKSKRRRSERSKFIETITDKGKKNARSDRLLLGSRYKVRANPLTSRAQNQEEKHRIRLVRNHESPNNKSKGLN